MSHRTRADGHYPYRIFRQSTLVKSGRRRFSGGELLKGRVDLWDNPEYMPLGQIMDVRMVQWVVMPQFAYDFVGFSECELRWEFMQIRFDLAALTFRSLDFDDDPRATTMHVSDRERWNQYIDGSVGPVPIFRGNMEYARTAFSILESTVYNLSLNFPGDGFMPEADVVIDVHLHGDVQSAMALGL